MTKCLRLWSWWNLNYNLYHCFSVNDSNRLILASRRDPGATRFIFSRIPSWKSIVLAPLLENGDHTSEPAVQGRSRGQEREVRRVVSVYTYIIHGRERNDKYIEVFPRNWTGDSRHCLGAFATGSREICSSHLWQFDPAGEIALWWARDRLLLLWKQLHSFSTLSLSLDTPSLSICIYLSLFLLFPSERNEILFISHDRDRPPIAHVVPFFSRQENATCPIVYSSSFHVSIWYRVAQFSFLFARFPRIYISYRRPSLFYLRRDVCRRTALAWERYITG